MIPDYSESEHSRLLLQYNRAGTHYALYRDNQEAQARAATTKRTGALTRVKRNDEHAKRCRDGPAMGRNELGVANRLS